MRPCVDMLEEVLMRPSSPILLRPRTESVLALRSGWVTGRSQEVLGIIVVNVGVLPVRGLAAELIYGQWVSGRPLGRLAVPRNVKKTIAAAPLYPGGTEFVYQRDAFGFRGAGVDPARISILTIGGSTTNQVYLPEEAPWQAVLERSLQEKGHDRGVVANADLKPPLVLWLIALASWPAHAVTVRTAILTSLLAALGVVLPTYWLGRRLFDADTGVVTALIVATTLGLYHIAHSSMPDMVQLIAGTGAIALCIGCDKAGPSAGMPQAG
jgi:Dolichyl-phosphate-mannose-protein mannosyltransferase